MSPRGQAPRLQQMAPRPASPRLQTTILAVRTSGCDSAFSRFNPKMTSSIEVTALGQTGYRICFGRHVVLIDPYLSNSVEFLAGPGARRLHRVPLEARAANDVDLVLITHAHLDHCDPDTLKPLSTASPRARFLAPSVCHPILRDIGIAESRILGVPTSWVPILPGLELTSVPACHPTVEVSPAGDFACVGYGLRFDGQLLYHAGDTVVCEEVLAAVKALGCPDWAFLPVNESNYFRAQANIIGNMSPREAFGFAQQIGAKRVVPTHWDLFPVNSTPLEEIRLVYRSYSRRFTLEIISCGCTVRIHPPLSE